MVSNIAPITLATELTNHNGGYQNNHIRLPSTLLWSWLERAMGWKRPLTAGSVFLPDNAGAIMTKRLNAAAKAVFIFVNFQAIYYEGYHGHR